MLEFKWCYFTLRERKVSDKTAFKTKKNITRDKGGTFIMIRRSSHWEDITITRIYV